ncbi:uncharacterized protein [Arachis hypogaea]
MITVQSWLLVWLMEVPNPFSILLCHLVLQDQHGISVSTKAVWLSTLTSFTKSCIGIGCLVNIFAFRLFALSIFIFIRIIRSWIELLYLLVDGVAHP